MKTNLTQFTLATSLLDMWRFQKRRNKEKRVVWHKITNQNQDVLDGLHEAIWSLSDLIATIDNNRVHDHNIPSFLE